MESSTIPTAALLSQFCLSVTMMLQNDIVASTYCCDCLKTHMIRLAIVSIGCMVVSEVPMKFARTNGSMNQNSDTRA